MNRESTEVIYDGTTLYECNIQHITEIPQIMRQAHMHSHYEILYIYNNEKEFYLEGKKYLIGDNTICFVPPHVMHKTVALNDRTMKKILINFTNEFITKYAQPLDIDPLTCFNINARYITFTDDQISTAKKIMLEMAEFSDRKDSYSQQMLALLLLRLLTFCSNCLPKSNVYSSNKLVNDIIQYMEGHYSEYITLDTLACVFYISKYEISRKFTKYMGINYIQYLTRIRIENSKKMLISTNRTITDIAAYVGFANPTNFTRVFKKAIGMSPSEYRKFQRDLKYKGITGLS